MKKESHIEWAGRCFGPAVKSIKSTAALLLCATATLAAHADTDNRAPDVPQQIVVSSETNKVSFHAFGVGFQVYTWNGTSWGGPVPDATLFHGEAVVAEHFGVFDGTHFVGPAWQSNSGSIVVGALPPASVIVDTNAIPWLRLSASTAE